MNQRSPVRRGSLGVALSILVLAIVAPSPGSASDAPPCTQTEVNDSPSGSQPGILWPCPGWDPIDNGVTATPDVNEDGVGEVAVGIRIPVTRKGIVFLLDGATAARLWYVRLDHPIARMAFLEGPNYIVAVSVNYETNDGRKAIATAYALSLSNGATKWTRDIPFAGRSPHPDLLAVGPDVDSDGVGDVAAGTDRGVVLLSGLSGAPVWARGQIIHQVKWMQDINGDAVPEVLATSHTGSACVMALSGTTGATLWKLSAQADMCVADPFDVNGDGWSEVVVGLTGTPSFVLVLDGRTGGVRAKREVPWPDFHAMRIVGSPDLNGDAIGDLVLTNATWGNPFDLDRRACSNGTGPCPGTVSAYSGQDCSLLWSDDSPLRAPNPLLRLPGEVSTFVAGTGWGPWMTMAEVYRLDASGARIWTYSIGPYSPPGDGMDVRGTPVRHWKDIVDLFIGPDIDQNGTPDILGVSANLRLYAISDQGALLWVFLP